MGNEKSSKISERLKSGVDKARVEAEKATKISIDAIKAGSSAAASGAKVVGAAAEKVSKEGGRIASKAAKDAGVASVKAKAVIDEKTRASLNAEYEKKRVVAMANLAELRAANPDCDPSELFTVLTADLDEVDAADFTAAASLFAVTAWQLRSSSAVETARQRRFIDLMVAVDSSAVKIGVKAVEVVVTYGPVVLSIAKKIPGPVGKAAKGLGLLLGKAKLPTKGNNAKLAAVLAKAAWLPAVMKLVGIKNPGKKSAAWMLASATKKALGELPSDWHDTVAEGGVAKDA